MISTVGRRFRMNLRRWWQRTLRRVESSLEHVSTVVSGGHEPLGTHTPAAPTRRLSPWERLRLLLTPSQRSTSTATAGNGGEVARRLVYSHSSHSPSHRGIMGNRITNTKYTVLTFLPLNLFEQFRYNISSFLLYLYSKDNLLLFYTSCT